MGFNLKILGIVGVILSLSGFGFFKASLLSRRVNKLRLISEGLQILTELISYSGEEIEHALNKSFSSCAFVTIKNRRAVCEDMELNVEDKRILNDMFCRLGSGDRDAELNRIDLCKGLIELQIKSAEDEYHQKSKIYKALGVCAGLAVGIFIL